MKQISVILIGAGNRGTKYVNYMHEMPERYKVVGVADPNSRNRERARQRYGLTKDACYESWEEILAQPKLANLAVIATMDELHYAPAMKAIELGYDILLEKPVAQTAQECIDIANAAKEKGVRVLVCHVLRYTPFFKKVKELLMSGAIGDVMSVIHVEAVGNLHQSHSFVRGKWHSEPETTPMLLAKSCHDLDIIQWLLDKPCKRVQSFGHLSHFRSENAPDGAPVRCFEGNCPAADTCPYNCVDVYVKRTHNSWYRCGETLEEVEDALRNTDYGLCVYHANNDVVDHQTVNMEFEGGITATFSMNAFNQGGRYIRIFGTKGELYAHANGTEITLYTFADMKTRKISITETQEDIAGGHGGGDIGIVRELYDYLSDSYTGFCAADIGVSVSNHLIGFAAEQARHEGRVVSVEEFCKENGYIVR